MFSNTTTTINRCAVQIGLMAAVLSCAAFLIFTAAFVIIITTQPLFLWTDLAAAVAYRESYGLTWATIAQATMLLFGSLYVLILHSIYELAPLDKKFSLRLSLHFGLAFAILTGIHYFLQISVVRLNILHGELVGLEQIIQANDHSAVSGINMLGWTLFFGLSSLFVAPAFNTADHLNKTIRVLFIVNGLCCLLGGVAFTLEWIVLLFITLNFGMGGAVTTLTILLIFWFRRWLLRLPAAVPSLRE